MRRVVLFIATSADGFIARKNGSYDWLPSDDNDYGYRAFIRSVDTVLMGRKTYEQTITFDAFPYPDKECIVFSRKGRGLERDPRKPPSVRIVRSDPVGFVRRLRRRKGGVIWLVGGASLIRPFQEAGLIDEYVIAICPVFIGSGIPLFLDTDHQRSLKLTRHRIYKTGVVQLTYVTGKSSQVR